jgi:hypothetical protein
VAGVVPGGRNLHRRGSWQVHLPLARVQPSPLARPWPSPPDGAGRGRLPSSSTASHGQFNFFNLEEPMQDIASTPLSPRRVDALQRLNRLIGVPGRTMRRFANPTGEALMYNGRKYRNDDYIIFTITYTCTHPKLIRTLKKHISPLILFTHR